jgi:hypothetical protein
VAYSVNIAVIPLGTTMRWLTAWDTGSPQPAASTLNDYADHVKFRRCSRRNGWLDQHLRERRNAGGYRH